MSTSTNDSFWTPVKGVPGRYEHEGYLWDSGKKMLVPPTGPGAWHDVRTKYQARELVEKHIAEQGSDPLITLPTILSAKDGYIDILFTDRSDQGKHEFVEVENELGFGINFGEWVDREDGFCALRIRPNDILKHLTQEKP